MLLPVPNPAVLCRPVPDGAVLLSTADRVYFGLNAVGARIWSLLPPATKTVSQLHRVLLAENPGVDPESSRADVLGLLAALELNGLVQRGESAWPTPAGAHVLARVG